MTEGTSIELKIRFREVRGTHVIHAFDVINGIESERAICGYKPTTAMTFALELEDVELNLCKSCLKRKSR